MKWVVPLLGLAIFSVFVTPKPVDETESCRIQDFEEQKDFDISKFTGTWYHIASSHRIEVSGVKLGVALSPTLSMVLQYSRDGKSCVTQDGYRGQQETAGRLKVSMDKMEVYRHEDPLDFVNGIIIVLQTDYNNALVFVCNNVEEKDTCNLDNSHLSLWSRDRNINDDWKKRFLEFVNKPCLNRKMFLTKQTESCDPALGDMHADTPINPECPMPMCASSCQHGYQVNQNGCQTCDCKPDPTNLDELESYIKHDVNLDCPIPWCANRCERGYRLNDNKCQTCYCNPDPSGAVLGPQDLAVTDVNPDCPTPKCANKCEQGYRLNDNKCQTCDCNPDPYGAVLGPQDLSAAGDTAPKGSENPCPIPMCTVYCPHGYKRDENNCEICECLDAPQNLGDPVEDHACATVMCANYCPYGYSKTDKGCDTCDCNALPENKTTDAQRLFECPLVWCELSCPKGLATDEMGCSICACKISTPCPIPMCENFCSDGYGLDVYGCQTCECLPKEKEEEEECPLLECNLICDNGLKKNDKGCQICECRQHSHCPVLLCPTKCLNGNIMDNNGCATCDCIGGGQGPEGLILPKPGCSKRLQDLPDFDVFKINGRWNILASRADLPHTDGATTRLLVDPHKTILTFFAGHRNNTCLPTFLGSYTPIRKTKVFRIRYGAYKTGIVRFLYVEENYDYIVIHQCLKNIDNNVVPAELSNNVATDNNHQESETLLDKGSTGNEQDENWCDKPHIDILSKRRSIPESVWSDISGILGEFCLTRADMDMLDVSVYCQPELNCNVNGFPSVAILSWDTFQGTWFALAKTDRTYDESELFKFVVHDGSITLYHTDARGNKCGGITKAKIIPNVYNSGEITVEFGRQKRHGKIIYTNYEVALFYECIALDSNGACPSDDTKLTILHRTRTVSEDYLQQFQGLIEMMCINPTRLSTIEHNVYCPITTGCTPNDFLGQQNFNVQKFLGRWNTILMKYNSSWDFVDMEINRDQGSTFTMIYTGAVVYNCSESMHAALYPVENDPASFRVVYGVMTGYLRVLWTDYNYALLYECHKSTPSGGCYPDSEHVTFVGRPGLPLPDMNEVDVDNLLGQICEERKDFKVSFRKVDCHLVKPEFVCRANGFSLQSDFTIDQIKGEWFVVGHTRHRVQNMEMVKMKVEQLSEDKVAFLIQQYMQQTGSCVTPTFIVGLKSRDHPAEFYSHSGKRPGLIRFASVTDSTALVYICPQDRPHDCCQPSEMTIVLLARTPTLDQKRHWDLMQSVADLCVSPSVIIPTKYNYACVIIPPFTPKCKLNNMPVMKKFDMKQFMGTWYVTSTVGRRRYDSPMVVIQPGREYFFVTFYGTEGSGKCHYPRRAMLQQRADSGEAVFDITFGEITGTLYVVYTDYQTALVYECDHIDDEGRCLPSHAQAYFLSRNTTLDMRLRAQLAKRFLALCLNPYDIKEVSHEVDCTAQSYQQCRPRMPVILESFNNTQVSGMWHSLIRSTNAPSWPGGVVNFTMGDNWGVELTATGRRFGECLFPADSHLTIYAGQSMWTRQDIGYAQLLSVSDDYVILLQCLTQTLDQCNPDNAQIDVLGRQPRVTSGAWEFLENTTESMCVSKKRFSATQPSGVKQCPLKAELKQQNPVCAFTNLDQLPKYDMKMLLGQWHTFAHLKHYPIAEAVNYHVTMESDGLLLAHNTAYSNGKCQPTFPTYVKEDETGVSHLKISRNKDFKDAGDVWLFYLSSKTVVWFECYNTQNNSCQYDDAFIEVSSRTHDLPSDQRGSVYDAMISKCFEMSDYVAARQTDDCQLSLDDRNCNFSAVEAIEEFDHRSVVGPWYKIKYTQGSETSLVTSVIFLYRNNFQLNALQFGKRSDGVCFEQVTGPIEIFNSSQPGLLRSYDGNVTALSKIIYHTEKYLIVFECIMEDSSLTTIADCPYEDQRVDIYSKSLEVSTEDILYLSDIVFRKTCFNTRRLGEIIPTDDCMVTTTLKSCRMEDIYATIEDLSLITGTWYQLAQTASMPDYKSDSGMSIFDEMSSDKIRIRYRGRFRYNVDKCTPLFNNELTRSPDDRSSFEYSAYPLTLGKGTIKFIYVANNVLITHGCLAGGVTSQGLCSRDKENISIYSRRRFINSELTNFMFDILRSRLCTSREEMVLINQTRDCYIGQEYQQPFKDKSCLIDDIPVQEGFNIQNFSGIWYEIEGTRNNGQSLWESVMSRYQVTEYGFLTLRSSGKSEGKCRGPYEAYMRPRYGSQETSDMLMWSGNLAGYGSPWTHPFSLKVVYTDYQVALLYSCYDVRDDGTCQVNSQHLFIISKSPDVSSATREAIYKIITAENSNICISLADMVHSSIDDSCISIALPDEKSEESLSEVPSCKDFNCDLVCDQGHQINQLGCPVCACNVQEDSDLDMSGDGETLDSIIGQEHGISEDKEISVDQKKLKEEETEYAMGSGEVNVISFEHVKCPPLACSLDCPNGLEMTADGCMLCQCAEEGDKLQSR